MLFKKIIHFPLDGTSVQIVLLEYCTFFTSKKLLYYNIVFIHFDWSGQDKQKWKIKVFP